MQFQVCVLSSILFFNKITAVPHYQAPILTDIELGSDSLNLVEERLLEYVTIGESTHLEVKAFGDTHLAFAEHSCPLNTETVKTCYYVDVSMWFCSYYIMEIIFLFEEDVLNDIEFDYHAGCL